MDGWRRKSAGTKAQFDIKFPPRIEGIACAPRNRQARLDSWDQEAGNCNWVWGSGGGDGAGNRTINTKMGVNMGLEEV